MTTSLFGELATLFEKVAEEEEQGLRLRGRKPEEPSTEERPAREDGEGVKEAAALVRELTGEAPSAKLAAEIAADPKVLSGMRKQAEELRRPERLGGPSDRPGSNPAPLTKKEAEIAAYERFGNFLLNGGRNE